MNEIIIYTDGSCLGNPGKGGWGFVVVCNDGEISESGSQNNTTNNRMELYAAIRALEYAKNNYKDQCVCIVTDSTYVKNGITCWCKKWMKNGWITSSGTKVKNEELWKELMELNEMLNTKWRWVKAHDVDKYNNMVDVLARNAAMSSK